MKRENFKCPISIVIGMILMMTIVNQAESYRSRDYLVPIAVLGDLVVVGKLLAIEGKVDIQANAIYTDVSVEVQHVIHNSTKPDIKNIKTGVAINFRPLGGKVGNRQLVYVEDAQFREEEIGSLVLLSIKQPSPDITAETRKGFDTIFDVQSGMWGKYSVKLKNGNPIVLAFWSERPKEEIGLPLDLVLQLMNMAVTVYKPIDIKKIKKLEDYPEEVRIKYTRIANLERIIRKMAIDGLPEEVIVKTFREEITRLKQELGL